MPEGDEGEDDEEVEDALGFGFEAAACGAVRVAVVFVGAAATAAEGDVEVADDPAVEGAVPGAPESEGGVVVGYAAGHVLGRVDAVYQRPETEEAPGDEQFQPDDVQVEVSHHAELGGSVERPVRGGFGDSHDIDEV